MRSLKIIFLSSERKGAAPPQGPRAASLGKGGGGSLCTYTIEMGCDGELEIKRQNGTSEPRVISYR